MEGGFGEWEDLDEGDIGGREIDGADGSRRLWAFEFQKPYKSYRESV